jgi:hypothetical protein
VAAPPPESLTGLASFPCLGVQRLDHLLGDVDPRADEDHRIALQDQVVLLGLVDLLDHAIRALDDRRELFVLALVQVFLEFAALALQLAVLVDQFALAAVALGFAQGRRVLVELFGGGLQARSGFVAFALALGELGLELGLRGLGWSGVLT